MKLMSDELLYLLDHINERFNVNAAYPNAASQSYAGELDGKLHIQVSPLHERFYRIDVGAEQIKISEETLQTLIDKKACKFSYLKKNVENMNHHS